MALDSRRVTPRSSSSLVVARDARPLTSTSSPAARSRAASRPTKAATLRACVAISANPRTMPISRSKSRTAASLSSTVPASSPSTSSGTTSSAPPPRSSSRMRPEAERAACAEVNTAKGWEPAAAAASRRRGAGSSTTPSRAASRRPCCTLAITRRTPRSRVATSQVGTPVSVASFSATRRDTPVGSCSRSLIRSTPAENDASRVSIWRCNEATRSVSAAARRSRGAPRRRRRARRRARP